MAAARVLVVDSDAVRRALFEVTLPAEQWDLVFVDAVGEGLAAIVRDPVEMALVMSGDDVAAIREAEPRVPVLLADSRYLDARVGHDEAASSGADGFVGVPFDTATFEARAKQARTAAERRARGHVAPRDRRAALRARVEQIHANLDRLDYYQLLGIDPGATPGLIKSGYYACAREFHPDRYHSLRDDDLRDKIYAVFKRMVEAFQVLGNPEKRTAYDQGLRGIDRAERLRHVSTARPHKGPRDPTAVAHTPEGRKYAGYAVIAENEGDLVSARLHLSIALQHEPHNEALRRRLAALDPRAPPQAAK